MLLLTNRAASLCVCAGGGAAGGLSADDLRAALRAAEDEADVAAAATAEKEVEAEMAEFTAEPPPEELKDEDLEGEDGETRTGTCTYVPARTRRTISWSNCLLFTPIMGVCLHTADTDLLIAFNNPVGLCAYMAYSCTAVGVGRHEQNDGLW